MLTYSQGLVCYEDHRDIHVPVLTARYTYTTLTPPQLVSVKLKYVIYIFHFNVKLNEGTAVCRLSLLDVQADEIKFLQICNQSSLAFLAKMYL